jgi:hypothetical protein
MASLNQNEIDREYRVLKQMLSMHSALRDRYSWVATSVDLILLGCAVIFCATTFAWSGTFIALGLSLSKVRLVLGIASVAAFLGSLVSLRVDWKKKSTRHEDAVAKLTRVLATFRMHRLDDGGWPEDKRLELHRNYWEAADNIVAIPEKKFSRLKAKHLRKVEVSKMLDEIPGCPVTILYLIVLFRSGARAWKKRHTLGQAQGNLPEDDHAAPRR